MIRQILLWLQSLTAVEKENIISFWEKAVTLKIGQKTLQTLRINKKVYLFSSWSQRKNSMTSPEKRVFTLLTVVIGFASFYNFVCYSSSYGAGAEESRTSESLVDCCRQAIAFISKTAT